jgi:hypothetical protein
VASEGVDYQQFADYLRGISFNGYLVLELAYEKNTQITRSLDESLRLSRHTEKVFGLRAACRVQMISFAF